MTKRLRKWRLRRRLAVLLVLAMLLSLCPAAWAEESCIRIGTLQELVRFAEACSSDSYSAGRSFVLTADIDADGTVVSIPLFLGSFDGNGHKISGLRLTESCSDYGFFSCIGEGAVVKNLCIEGEISPSGTQSGIGGLAGENEGTIENCSFSGMVSGDGKVGGLVGINRGTIAASSVSGTVCGMQYTGGIAGQNQGTILQCENHAAVNANAADEDFTASDLSQLEDRFYSILKQEETTEDAVTADTGGIAGRSIGVIQSCRNHGAVGYPHVGYNVGGIVGRQNGYLASCANDGEIQGRKDVGGIVGQMEPDITLQFFGTSLDDMRTELRRLQNLMQNALEDAQSASNNTADGVRRAAAYADRAMDSADSLRGQLQDFVDNNMDTANHLLLLLDRYLAKLTRVMDSLTDAAELMSDGISDMQDVLTGMDGVLSWNETALQKLQGFSAESKAVCDALLSGLDALDAAFEKFEGGPARPDTAGLRTELAKLRSDAEAMEATVSAAEEELRSTGSVSAETRQRLQEQLQTVLSDQTAVLRDTVMLLRNTDFGALQQQNEETLRQVLQLLQSAMNDFYSAGSHGSAAMGDLCDALSAMREINHQMSGKSAQLDTALQMGQKAADAVSRAASRAAGWVQDLADEDTGSFSPLGTAFSESSDALHTSLSGMSRELSALNDEVNSSNTMLLSDLQEVNDQFMKVMNLFLDALDDVQGASDTELFQDVSEETLRNAVRGKVLECSNEGAVTADRNAGGIAGAMAIEYDGDPEDDLLSSENHSARFTYQTQAILLDCSNAGTVQAKKSCAGGIVGRMDLGIVSGCGGYGDVTCESGDYAGGVAGLSLAAIRGSYAKCTLSGGKYVGGIAGSGRRVTDCISMVRITDCTQRGGAVAGEITAEYSGNVFVSDALAGVDRVSFTGKAEKLSYETLCTCSDLPEEFLHMTLRFTADDKVLKEVEFDYGASFTEDVLPEIPEKEDMYGRWDTSDLTALHFDTVVTAVYEPYSTTICSDVQQDGHAAILAEGSFREGDVLQAEAQDTANAPAGAVMQWKLRIPEDGQRSHTIRCRLPEEKGDYDIYIRKENGWQKTNSEKIGHYLCFEMEGDGTFSVVPRRHWFFFR